MVQWKVPLYKVFWDEDDVEYVNKVIRRGFYWTGGPEVKEFEEAISEYVGTKYALTFNSGTSALHALMLAYGFKEGDEIIVPSFTFIATANAVLYVNAKPVFAEIEETTYGLDPNDVVEKINDKTKAILPIHYGGGCSKIKELLESAEDHNLLLIEDAAEAVGTKLNGRHMGTFGDSAILSFCGNKVMTTGEGGAVVTNNKEIYEKLKLIRSHGRVETESYFSSVKSFDYVLLGYNWRMSDITAALGLSQLKKLEKAIELRRKIAQEYTEFIEKKLSGHLQPPRHLEGCRHVYQMYTIRVKDGREVRDKLKAFLAEKGIMSKIYFDPIHLTSLYKNRLGYKEGDLPRTERISGEVLTLPIYPTMTNDELNYVKNALLEFFESELP